ncbi:MAG: ABC transporter ATP-binding protein [Thermodesulfobacteriota bacterium]
MLSVNQIEVFYHSVIQVLKGVSLKVNEGQIVALLGANGAGKTTTLKAISGLLKAEAGEVTDGEILFLGHKIDHELAHRIAKKGIIQVLEGRRLFKHLTVEENLRVGYMGSGGEREIRQGLEMVYGLFPKLHDLRHSTSGFLSGGEAQMLVIGRGLISKPKIMLLDEPSLGLAPLLIQAIFGIIARINQEEKTAILLVEQNALAALEISNYCYVMENGRIVLDGQADKLRENEDIKEFYLGLSKVGSRKSYKEIKHYKRRKRWLS